MLSSLPPSRNSPSPCGFSAPFPDVECEYAAVSPTLEGPARRGALWQAAPGQFLLDVPGVARFLVEAGQRITIDAAPHAQPVEIERFLGMAPLAALRWQRGLLAFHAAALAGPNGAVLIAGDSGVGKSTLLACLLEGGWTMLADDIALPDRDAQGQWTVRPTRPEILLWPDALNRLRARSANACLTGLNVADLNDSGLSSAYTAGRRLTAQAERFASGPCPLRGLYWLSLHSGDGVQMSEIQGAERFKTVGALAYNTRIADALLNREAYFRQSVPLAGSVPMWRLQRPRGQWTAEALAARIAQEMA